MGRKKKFGEESDFVSVRVPKSKKKEYRTAIKDFVENMFATKTDAKDKNVKIKPSKESLTGFRKFEEFVKEVKNLDNDENILLQRVIQMLKSRHAENLIAIYGIGSFFNEQLPRTWITLDIDLILIVKSLTDIPKAEWEKRFFLKKNSRL